MSYQVLARKWRPQNFQEMVGQEHVLKALGNALNQDRLHHAYLFTGTRGVGKTTVARIFAKSLNCETGITSQPCGECAVCTEITEGRFVDLIEIDAASRTKVEDMRELLDNVQYAPTRGRYKIYLIDEVHMLSNSSFNALLKTLEEPPPHIKFLLATTDPQKLPVTILSRCLQFNLKNLSPERIVKHLAYVLQAEQVPAEEAALWELAKAAEGSMRDALSLTDQAIAFGNGEIKAKDVIDMLGTIEKHVVIELLQLVASSDTGSMLAKVQHMAEFSPDYAYILQAIAELLHRVAIEQAVPGAIDNSFGDQQQVVNLARQMAAEDTQLFYQIALTSRKDLALAPDPRVGFEMALLRMVSFRPNAQSGREIHTGTSAATGAGSSSSGADKESDPAPSVLPSSTESSANAKTVDFAPLPVVESNTQQEGSPAPTLVSSVKTVETHSQSESAKPSETAAELEAQSSAPEEAKHPSQPPAGSVFPIVEAGGTTTGKADVAVVEVSEVVSENATASDVQGINQAVHGDVDKRLPQDEAEPAVQSQTIPSNSSTGQYSQSSTTGYVDDYPDYDPGAFEADHDDMIPVRESYDTYAEDSYSKTPSASKESDRANLATPVEPVYQSGSSDATAVPELAVASGGPALSDTSEVAGEEVDDDDSENQEEELESYQQSAKSMERDFDVTLVSKVQNTGEPQLNGLTWDEVLRQLSVSGMTRSLAQRCVMQDVLGQRVEFVIDHDHFDFFNEVHNARLRAALSEFMGENVTIEVVAGEASFLSPLQKVEKKRAELQAEAEREIREDIHVNALIQRFGATVIDQSIEPIIREL